MKKFLKWTGIILSIMAVIGFSLYMVYLRPFIVKMKQTGVVSVDPGFFVVTGGGGNTGVIMSDSLLMLIDTKMDDAAQRLADTIKVLQGKRKLLVINTHWHPDHVGGNHLYNKDFIMAGGSYAPEAWKKEAGEKSLPGQWLQKEMWVPLGNDTATIINLARNVHTPSDIFVYLHSRKVLFAGDVILNQQAPILMGDADGDAYMEEIQNIRQRFDIRMVVPGHGLVGGLEVLDRYYIFFEDMKTAAKFPDTKMELLEKYKYWNQIPLIMSPRATMKHFRKKLSATN